MKKLVTLATVLAMSVSVVSAQFTYGVKAGPNFANLTNADTFADFMAAGLAEEGFDATFDAKMRTSFHIGAFGEYKVSDLFSVAAELLYSGQGAKAEFKGEGFSGEIKQKFGYLNVPVLAKLYLTDDLSLDVGPQFGFLMSSKSAYEVTAGGQTTKGDEDSKEGLNKTDISAALGLTYNFGNIFVQGRYNLGLNEFVKDNEGDDKFKNNVIQLSVGYRF
ncbi:MAG: PorT family protein [Rikenellaceae bacterium]|jgi:hypothetical protein|nr:PorT family protein [Rikenellaceae bacterium]